MYAARVDIQDGDRKEGGDQHQKDQDVAAAPPEVFMMKAADGQCILIVYFYLFFGFTHILLHFREEFQPFG